MIELGVFHNGASDLPTITTPTQIVAARTCRDNRIVCQLTESIRLS